MKIWPILSFLVPSGYSQCWVAEPVCPDVAGNLMALSLLRHFFCHMRVSCICVRGQFLWPCASAAPEPTKGCHLNGMSGA